MVSAPEPERHLYAHALNDLSSVGRVTFVSAGELAPRAGQFEPELVIVSIKGPTDGLRALYQLLGPELRGRGVIAAVYGGNSDMDRVLGRIGVHSCAIGPHDISALRHEVSTWISGGCGRHRPRPAPSPRAELGNAATARKVADVLRETHAALSAHDVAARCGFSVVTSRRYLKLLVAWHRATENTQHRSVGRPVTLYRWAG